jgi:hypothetical protein
VTGRLPSALLVAAMMRQTQDAGGFAAMLARGEADGGGILILAVGRETTRLLERGVRADGSTGAINVTPRDADPQVVEDYWRRRRKNDPDLWVIELDSPQAERFVAEALASN